MSNNQVKNSSILLVEDNSFYKNTVERILKQEGFNNIKTADNGLEAMTILDTEKIDAVLLDIDMPVMNGYEVLQKIKSSKHLRDIPVIVISVIENMESILRCIELGADDYLPKPARTPLLIARLKTSLNKKIYLDKTKEYFEKIEWEKKQNDNLLSIILPNAAAEELKNNGFFRPKLVDNVAVLFCDIEGFTSFCDNNTAQVIVDNMTEWVERLEQTVAKYGMEKIKTIGNEFMATANLLEKNNSPIESALNCGLEIAEASQSTVPKWKVKIGIHYGDVVAGIIGREKYQFDLWGSTISKAAQITKLGEHGSVLMTKELSKGLSGQYDIHDLEVQNIKGLGNIEIVSISQSL